MLRAVQIIVDEKLAKPILIGRPSVIEHRIQRYGLRLTPGTDFTVVNTEHDERYRDFWQTYYKMMARKGISEQLARVEMRRRTTLIGSMLVKKGEADGMICGTISTTHRHLHFIDQVIGKRPGCSVYAAMNGLVLPGRQIFLVDTHVNVDPTRKSWPRSRSWRRKKCAASASSRRSHCCRTRISARATPFCEEDARYARDPAGTCARAEGGRRDAWRRRARRGAAQEILPESTLEGEANLLILPNIDSANIAYNLLKTAAGNNIAIGPILLGAAQPVRADRIGDRSPHRQHGGAAGRRRERHALSQRARPVEPAWRVGQVNKSKEACPQWARRGQRKRASLKQHQHLSPLSVAGVARRQSLAMPEMPPVFYLM